MMLSRVARSWGLSDSSSEDVRLRTCPGGVCRRPVRSWLTFSTSPTQPLRFGPIYKYLSIPIRRARSTRWPGFVGMGGTSGHDLAAVGRRKSPSLYGYHEKGQEAE